MALLGWRESQGIDRRRSLASVPVLHDNVLVEEDADKNLVLKVRFERGTGFLARFRPPVSVRRYELDQFGSFVVQQMKSERTVMDVVVAFEARFKMCHREAELGVVAFLKMLMKRHLVSMVLKEPA